MPGRWWSATRRGGPVAVLAALLGGCALLGWDEPVLVLQDLGAGDGPSLLKLTTPEPAREAVRFEVDGTGYRADLYRPAEPPRAGLLLVPGAAPGGKDEPRLVAFARTLARARFLVLVPDLVDLRRFTLDEGNVDSVADSALHLAGRPSVQGLPVGIAALSYSVGPAVLAAGATRPGSRVDFLLGIGGYYDLRRAITYAVTGCVPTASGGRCRAPDPYAQWALVQSLLGHVRQPGDRELLELLTWRYLEDPERVSEQRVAALGSEARAAFELLRTEDPDAVPTLLARLPDSVGNAIDALDLSRRDLSGLEAELILVHGLDDPMVPAVESRALAEAVPAGRAELFLVAGLAHVDIDPERLDRGALLAAVRALLARRAGP